MDEEVCKEERPKTPTQLRRLQEEEERNESMTLLAKKESNDEKNNEEMREKTRNLGLNVAKKETEQDNNKRIHELQIDDPSSSSSVSPHKGSFKDFIFSPKAETISSSSAPLQRNQLKAMM